MPAPQWGRWTKYAAGLVAALGWFFLLACLWPLLPPRHRAVLNNGGKPIPVCFSPDARTLVTTESSKTSITPGPVRLWDANTGRERYTLVPGWSNVQGIEFSPDGQLLAARNEGYHLKVWDVATGNERADLELGPKSEWYGHTRFSPDWRFLIFQRGGLRAEERGPLYFRDIDTGLVRATVEGKFEALAFAPDGRHFALSHRDRRDRIANVQLWVLGEAPQYVTLVKQYDVACDELAFSPSLDRFASAEYAPGRENGVQIKVWDMATGSWQAGTVHRDPETRIRSLSFSADGQFLIAQSSNTGRGLDRKDRWVVWDLINGLIVARTCEADPTGCAVDPVLSPDGRWFASWDGPGPYLVEMTGLGQRRSLLGPGDSDSAGIVGWNGNAAASSPGFRFSPDSRVVLVTGLLHLSPTSAINEYLSGTSPRPWTSTLSPIARVWDVKSGTELAALPGCAGCLLSPDGRALATTDMKGTVRLWDVPPRRPLPLILALTTASWAALVGLALLLGRWRRSRRPAAA